MTESPQNTCNYQHMPLKNMAHHSLCFNRTQNTGSLLHTALTLPLCCHLSHRTQTQEAYKDPPCPRLGGGGSDAQINAFVLANAFYSLSLPSKWLHTSPVSHRGPQYLYLTFSSKLKAPVLAYLSAQGHARPPFGRDTNIQKATCA